MYEVASWRAALPEASWFDPFFLPLVAAAMKSLRDSAGPPCKFLHIGCGGAVKSEAFRRLGYDVTGVDINARSLASARQRFPALELVEADAHELPFADASFDVVFSFSCLQMMQRRSTVVKQCARVLKPGGRAVFIENLADSPFARGYRAFRESTGYGRGYRTYDYLTVDGANVFEPWFEQIALEPFHVLTPAVLVVPALAHAILGHPMRIASQVGYATLARIDRAILQRSARLRRLAWHCVATMSRSPGTNEAANAS